MDRQRVQIHESGCQDSTLALAPGICGGTSMCWLWRYRTGSRHARDRRRPDPARYEEDAVLGKPQKDWISDDGVHYFTYQYDTGRPPNILDAAGFVFMDLVTAGL